MMKCDPETGVCRLPGQDELVDGSPSVASEGLLVRYVGDPMCSWCWGIAPTVGAVEAFCEKEGIGFAVTVGGLRAGGGELWNVAFKDFLRTEWKRIGEATGQPFGFKLLDEAEFDYDTEPACRAVATVKLLQARQGLPGSIVLAFFSAIQHKFYVEGRDPKQTAFYASICTDLAVDFDAFRSLFESPEAREAVQQDFVRCRQWAVRSFPTLLLERDGKVELLAAGYVTTEQLLSRLQQRIS